MWGHPIAVDWAEPEVEVDEDTMSSVKILYVRNLMLSTSEEMIEKEFNSIKPGGILTITSPKCALKTLTLKAITHNIKENSFYLAPSPNRLCVVQASHHFWIQKRHMALHHSEILWFIFICVAT